MVSSLDNWDGGLSKTVKQNSTRIAGSLLESSPGINKTTAIQDARIDVPTIGSRHGLQNSNLDVNFTNDASNLNQPLSRDGIIQRPLTSSILSIVAPPNGITTSPSMSAWKTFIPPASTPLHDKKIRSSPVVATPVVLTVTSKGLSPPSSMNLDTLEAISTYSADGEGDDEAEVEEITVVHDMIPVSTSQIHEQNLPHSSAPSHLSPLSMLLPEEEWDTRPVDSLFTPSPSPKQTEPEPSDVHRRSHSPRLVMSHIEIPPFKRPRSDYRPFLAAHSSIVNKRRVPSGPPSMAHVIQAPFQHNTDVGVLVYDSLGKKKRKLTKRNEDREVIVVAGPSAKKRLKRSLMDDDDRGASSRSKKRSHPSSGSMVVDLTISDDNEWVGRPEVELIPKPTPDPISKSLTGPRPARKPKFIHAAYNSETDVVTLCLEDIRPVPLEVLTLNTRFLRQSPRNANKGVSGPISESSKPAKYNINRTRQNGSRPCILSIAANSSSSEDVVEEISVGGIIWELTEEDIDKEDIDKEVIEISSDSDANLKENVPQKHVNMPSVSTSQVAPLIPNVLKNQHQKAPRESYQRRQQPNQRRQPAGDDVDRSSSTFEVPYEKVGSPRATPSSTKVSPATSQRQHPRKKRQIVGGDINGSSYNTSRGPVVKPSPPPPHVQPSTPKVNVTPNQKKPRESQLEHPSSGNGIKSFSTSSGPSHASLGRPPHSARSSLKGHNPDPGSEFPNRAMPSAKALGKRRATSPTTVSPTSLQRHYHSPVPSYFAASIRDTQLSSRLTATTPPPPHDPYAVQNSDFNPFIDYSTTSPAMQSPPLSTSYIPLDTSYLYDQSSSSQNLPDSHIGGEVDTSPHHLSSLDTHLPTQALVYNSQPQPESRGESFFSSADSLYNDAGFPGNEQQHYDTTIDDSWSASLVTNHSEGQYIYETIDPTLLGGGALAEVEPGPEMDVDMMDKELDLVGTGMEFEPDDQVQQKDSSQLGSGLGLSKESSPSSSTDSSSSSFGSIRAKKTHDSASANCVPAVDKESGREEENKRKLPPRIRTKRVMPNMISHDEIDLLASTKFKRRLTLPAASSAPDADGSGSDSSPDHDSDDDKPTVRKPIPKLKAKKSSKQHPRARSISPIEQKKLTVLPEVDKNQAWQMDEEDAYCHQCRRKTFYAKMTCSECQKKFCVRCYAFRYPDCEFDADAEEYSCPACEGFCNCTACCRKRGETYVGPRNNNKVPDSPPPPPQRLRNTDVDVIRVKSSGKPNLPRPTKAKVIPTTTIPKGVTKAWGSLYSVTGEKIGACFFDPSAEDKAASVVFAPATTSILTTITNVAQQQVAVEEVAVEEEPKNYRQPEIRVKTMKRRTFIGVVQPCWGYTKPKTRLLKAEPYAKRSYNAMPRYYIGKKKYLFYPIEEDESSLTSMSESEEVKEPDGSDLEGKSFSPDSLGDGDVTRAILLGLNACGVAAVEVPI